MSIPHEATPALRDLNGLLLESLPVCVLVGAEHIVALANDACQRLFPDRPLLGREFRDVFPELGESEVLWMLDDVYQSGEPATAGELRAQEPRRGVPRDVYLSLRAQPVRGPDGEIQGLLCVLTDVTPQVAARRRVEALERRSAFLAVASATLASSLEATETLATVAHLAVHHFADWCCVALVGAAAEGELGTGTVAASDPITERLVAEMQRNYPPEPGDTSLAGRALAIGEPLLMSDCRNANPPFALPLDERHVEILEGLAPRSAMAVPLRARGQALGVMTLAWVKPGRPYTPEDLALADEFGRHAAFAVDNARLYHAAQAGIRAREEFLSIAGHELKTPLTALKLNLQGLERAWHRKPPPAPEALVDRLGKMGRQVARLERLVNELLDVSRVTAGRLVLEPERLDLREVVRDVATRAEDDLAECGSQLTIEGPEPVEGVWDPTRIDQVVTNLVSNAIKYGQGRAIEVTVERDGRIARLRVRDHGIGIPRDKQPYIFERFERAVSDRHYGGFGLGLWIVRRIVEASGGAIRCEPPDTQGSCFVVELPLSPAPGGPQP